ncbi:MAG: hypothetical protein DRI57_09875 [Deltaproteobacteria bacterium]|nr:MAG: hypothetical protein DRI57_09875 [Deltaproteobacteria bacterium]
MTKFFNQIIEMTIVMISIVILLAILLFIIILICKLLALISKLLIPGRNRRYPKKINSKEKRDDSEIYRQQMIKRQRDDEIRRYRQQMTSKEKGNAFEHYIIRKFDRKFFTLKDMRSDKGVPGFYPESNRYPDLVLEYRPAAASFAVECKWRAGWWKRNDGRESIDWAGGDHKIRNYNDYSEKNNIPVFVAIGVGGGPDNPTELYIVPLRCLKYRYAEKNYLRRFMKKNKGGNFFFDFHRNLLN